VPASAAVEELAAARAQEREDVLEVGCGARPSAERCRIERAAARGEEDEACETAADLEAARADILVRQPIAREVEDRAKQERRESRPAGGTGRGARRHVKRDDHGYRPSRRAHETRAEATYLTDPAPSSCEPSGKRTLVVVDEPNDDTRPEARSPLSRIQLDAHARMSDPEAPRNQNQT